MSDSISNQVVDFYHELFGEIFLIPFEAVISGADRRKLNRVRRQIEELADTASQSLERFFVNAQVGNAASCILIGLRPVSGLLKIEDISNPNFTPEAVVEKLLPNLSCPVALTQERQEAVFRVALYIVVQVLLQVGPLMAEWQRLSFSSQFELLRRVNDRLNQISEQLTLLSAAGQDALDDRYELSYRDHLLQRFYRVEAGTVRMTTNMNVDLRELFVMPRLSLRERPNDDSGMEDCALMTLTAARKVFSQRQGTQEFTINEATEAKEEDGISALDQVLRYPRNVVVGAPGGGKSTFFEWLQVQVADGVVKFPLAGQQALPLLLRVRQLDVRQLPTGAALVAKALDSNDRARLMPDGWIERQLSKGVVLFMLDGLDETEPELLENCIVPWLKQLCDDYSACRFLISSRPVGYPAGLLRKLEFAECDLLDFNDEQIADYTTHWCTSVRLARNEPEEEARREGSLDGGGIVQSFQEHSYIRHLARNPLMLSAICLVNYFEQGELPTDRAVLYKLCVEGLLHNWDQRRGIRSEFSLEEKLRVAREVAIAMQADDRAESEAGNVKTVMADTLNDERRAATLMEHIRYRTGLLIERRAGVFAFAHLTFQEYLAALAVHEGNRRNITAQQLANEHDDGRWNEVIALYCGFAPVPAVRSLLEWLIEQPDTSKISAVLTEAFLSSRIEIRQDANLRRGIIERVALAPGRSWPPILERFSEDEVKPIANQKIGRGHSQNYMSEACGWLYDHPESLIMENLIERLHEWRILTPMQMSDVLYLLARYAPDETLNIMIADKEIFEAPGPLLGGVTQFKTQAEIALVGLARRASDTPVTTIVDAAILQTLRIIAVNCNANVARNLLFALETMCSQPLPEVSETWLEVATLLRQIISYTDEKNPFFKETVKTINAWIDKLEKSAANQNKPRRKK